MTETFVTPQEYPSYYASLRGLRLRVASDIGLKPGMRVLDAPTGSAFFAIEMSRLVHDLDIIGIDLAESDIVRAYESSSSFRTTSRLSLLRMDAASLAFAAGSFDVATTFLGLEDVHMTRGIEGVRQAVSEVARVLKPGGLYCLAVMPPDEMVTEAQKLEVAAFDYACGARWLPSTQYLAMLDEAGLALEGQRIYTTGAKLAPAQARKELLYACRSTPDNYGIQARTFEQVWGRFGPEIEKHGMGHYSRVVVYKATKGNR